MTRLDLAEKILRLFPPPWRRRYEDEVLDDLSRGPVRLRDLFDLLRSAPEEWERYLARSAGGVMIVIAVGYVVLGVLAYGMPIAIALFQHWFLGSSVNLGVALSWKSVEVVMTGLFAFLLPMYAVGVMLNAPIFIALRLARRRVSPGFARFVAAAGLVCWAQWAIYQLDGNDIWRWGIPARSYWLTTVLPAVVAWASVGALIGGGLVGDGATRPTARRA